MMGGRAGIVEDKKQTDGFMSIMCVVYNQSYAND